MKKKKALAMVFREVRRPFAATPFQWPQLREGEVLAEVQYATICSSDLHTFYGRRGGPCPSILGHETMGRIVDIGPGSPLDYHGEALRIGDTITWSVYAHDHGSAMARKGFPQKSEGLLKYGHERIKAEHQLSGGFATHCHLKKGTHIFRLPTEMPLKAAAPISCTHATMAGALRLAGPLEDKNVLIIGAGMLGLSACAMSREAGAAQVWSMDVNEERLRRSGAFGVDGTLDANRPLSELAGHLKAIGGADVVFETSGVASAIETGLQLLNIGGISIWVGAVYTQPPVKINAEKIVRNLLTIKGLHNYRPEDLATAVRFVVENYRRYPFEKLVSTEFPLRKLDRAFQLADQRNDYRIGIYPEQ